MIRFLFLIIIAAIVLPLAFYQFKSVPMAKKMTISGGGLAAAAVGILLQNGFAWYLTILAIIAVSLGAAMLYMKMLEREQVENLRLAEERKERRQSLINPGAEAQPVLSTIQSTPKKEKISVPQEIAEENTEESLEEPQPERETVPPSFGMQSIQPMGKEHSREQ